MNTIMKLFFGNWRRAGWTIGILMLIGFFRQVSPEVTDIALGSIIGTIFTGAQILIFPIVLLCIVGWMVKKLFGK